MNPYGPPQAEPKTDPDIRSLKTPGSLSTAFVALAISGIAVGLVLPLFDSAPIAGLRPWLVVALRWGGVIVAAFFAILGTYELRLWLVNRKRQQHDDISPRDDHAKPIAPVVEALVVVAIFGILAALKLPAVGQAGPVPLADTIFAYVLLAGLVVSFIWTLVQCARWVLGYR